MLSFFQNFFLGNLLLHLWVSAIYPVSSKNLVKQVYSPRTLDQSRGKCCPFFKFLLGQFACPSLTTGGKLFQISFKKLVRQVNSPRFLDQTGGNAALFFQISSWAICFYIFGSQQGQMFPSFFQETGEASLFSKIFGSKQGKCCPFFRFLLWQFAFASLGHHRGKSFQAYSKKLVRQVYSPRSLDQSRGEMLPFSLALLFSYFSLGNSLFHLCVTAGTRFAQIL